MNDSYQKTEIPKVYRDPQSGALVNTDVKALEGYKKQKAANRRVKNLEQKQNEMERSMYEIKSLLHDVLEKLDK